MGQIDFLDLNKRIIECDRCPRLRAWCHKVAKEKRQAFREDIYWGKPVPNFGDPNAKRLIVGLAPAAHGANRTGRMFTGDRSGDWLFWGLHEVGLASQAESRSLNDGLTLTDVLITAVCHCAPPDNKPEASEIDNCRGHLADTLDLSPFHRILCLGGLAWKQTHKALGAKLVQFGHGVESVTPAGVLLIASYHPSQQNTFTGKLTREMFLGVLERFSENG